MSSQNAAYRIAIHGHLANGETNRADGAWTHDTKGREMNGKLPATLAANTARNKRNRERKAALRGRRIAAKLQVLQAVANGDLQ